jgi:hypothetical protein
MKLAVCTCVVYFSQQFFAVLRDVMFKALKEQEVYGYSTQV